MRWLLTIHMIGWTTMSAVLTYRMPIPREGLTRIQYFRRYMAMWGIAAVWEIWMVEELLKYLRRPADDPDDGW